MPSWAISMQIISFEDSIRRINSVVILYQLRKLGCGEDCMISQYQVTCYTNDLNMTVGISCIPDFYLFEYICLTVD